MAWLIEWRLVVGGELQHSRPFDDYTHAYEFKLKMDDAWPGREHTVAEVGREIGRAAPHQRADSPADKTGKRTTTRRSVHRHHT